MLSLSNPDVNVLNHANGTISTAMTGRLRRLEAVELRDLYERWTYNAGNAGSFEPYDGITWWVDTASMGLVSMADPDLHIRPDERHVYDVDVRVVWFDSRQQPEISGEYGTVSIFIFPRRK